MYILPQFKKKIENIKEKKSPSYNSNTQGASEQTQSELHRPLEKPVSLH